MSQCPYCQATEKQVKAGLTEAGSQRSRCFSRCLKALRRAVKLFVYAWNQRQLYRQKHPAYDAHLIHFLYPLN